MYSSTTSHRECPTFGRALAEPLNLPPVRAESNAEHVGADFSAHALALELAHRIEEHLVCDLRQGRPPSTRRRKLRDEDRRLADDGVNQKLDGHCAECRAEDSQGRE